MRTKPHWTKKLFDRPKSFTGSPGLVGSSMIQSGQGLVGQFESRSRWALYVHFEVETAQIKLNVWVWRQTTKRGHDHLSKACFDHFIQTNFFWFLIGPHHRNRCMTCVNMNYEFDLQSAATLTKKKKSSNRTKNALKLCVKKEVFMQFLVMKNEGRKDKRSGIWEKERKKLDHNNSSKHTGVEVWYMYL